MRISSSSKFVGGALAALAMGIVPALAQEAVQPPAPAPAQVPAPVAEPAPAAAPAQAAPADAAAAPAPAQAAPADTAAAPAPAAPAVVAEAPKPAEPPPVLPTSGDGAVIVKLLSDVCKPLIAGANLEQLAKANGMKKDNKTGEFVVALAQKPFQISVAPTGENNKNVCEMHVRYAPGWDQPIVDSMNVWRFLQDPQLHLQRNDIGQYKDSTRTTTTWDNWDNQSFDGKMIGLVLVQLNKADGGPVTPQYDEAIIQYSQRKALSAQGVAQSLADKAPPVARETSPVQQPAS